MSMAILFYCIYLVLRFSELPIIIIKAFFMLRSARFLLLCTLSVVCCNIYSFSQQNIAAQGIAYQAVSTDISAANSNFSSGNKNGFIKDALFNKPAGGTRTANDSLKTLTAKEAQAANKNILAANTNTLPANSFGSNGNNVAKGTGALANNTTGIDNTAHGYMALQSNTAGVGNTAIGVSSLQNNTTGIHNTANGSYSLGNNTIGERNTAYGALSLGSNLSGSANTAVGYQSMLAITTGNNNTAIGHNAMVFATAGNDNTSVGTSSLYSNHTGNNNTAIGTSTLSSNMDGSNNVGSGVRSLEKNINGNNNTAIGFEALSTNVNGNYNTVLGYTADVAADGISNATALGSGAKVFSSNTIQLGNAAIRSVVTSGNLVANGVALTTDFRLKQNIMPVSEGLSTVLKLNPVHYENKNSNTYSKTENGFIAQEIQKVMPFIVTEGTDKDHLLSVDYISIIPVLTKAIQEQQNQIQQQAEDIKTLKKLVSQLLEKK